MCGAQCTHITPWRQCWNKLMDDEAAFLRNLLEELTPSPAAAATVAALATRGQQRSLSSSTALQKWFQPKPLSSCDMGSVVG